MGGTFQASGCLAIQDGNRVVTSGLISIASPAGIAVTMLRLDPIVGFFSVSSYVARSSVHCRRECSKEWVVRIMGTMLR